MIVFGDRHRRRLPAEQIQILRAARDEIRRQPPGIARHAALVSALLSAGELAQALADAAFDRHGCDRHDAAAGAAMRVAVALGQAVWRSHQSGYARLDAGDLSAALADVARSAGPEAVTVRAAEGFQHYAVYPEAYALAAAAAFPDASTGTPAPVIVGIRTIGATLAAAVAGPLSAPELPLTVRPVGPPFERRVALADDVAGALAAARGRPVAIVDEGPGLSGSSFGAVLDALETAGVPESDARVFPSHDGRLGGAASPRNRARWDRVRRLYVPFEHAFLNPTPQAPGLVAWVHDLIGPVDEPPEDVAAGGWRRHHWPDPRAWPPAIAMRERRKFLLRARGETFLARFGGLGEPGRDAAARAQVLGEAGLSPPVVGGRHGFLLTRWMQGARPLWSARAAVPRADLIARVAAYLAFRAQRFASDASRGAAPAALLEMAALNAAEGGCPDAGRRIERFAPWVSDLARAARPIEVDARLHAWEWLVLPDGRLWKTDGVDHCDGHDPIGCQDLVWDVAGAAIELELDAAEQTALTRALAARGHPVDPEPLAFYTAAYLAFQLGLYATGAAAAGDPDESARLSRATNRYRKLLASVY